MSILVHFREYASVQHYFFFAIKIIIKYTQRRKKNAPLRRGKNRSTGTGTCAQFESCPRFHVQNNVEYKRINLKVKKYISKRLKCFIYRDICIPYISMNLSDNCTCGSNAEGSHEQQAQHAKLNCCDELSMLEDTCCTLRGEKICIILQPQYKKYLHTQYIHKILLSKVHSK